MLETGVHWFGVVPNFVKPTTCSVKGALCSSPWPCCLVQARLYLTVVTTVSWTVMHSAQAASPARSDTGLSLDAQHLWDVLPRHCRFPHFASLRAGVLGKRGRARVSPWKKKALGRLPIICSRAS